ncbi:MAG: FG-GAP-like repeat-containing protein [Pseudomonadota bacterium]
MANLVAFAQFDIENLDLHFYWAFTIDSALEKNANLTINDTTYPDLFWVEAYDGFDDLELDFLGSGFTQDGLGNITGGTVNFIAEYDIFADEYFWYGEGISVSAVDIYNAAQTPSNADELALIVTAFSGNDTLTLSAFADRMSGYAGNDMLTGGLGADILSGGTGDDTFIDTEAGLNGDTITDFVTGDRIVITDATLAGFTFSLSGSTLTFTGGSLTLTGGVSGTLVASAASGGGVQLTIQAVVTPPADVRNDFNGDGRSDILWRNVDGQMSNWLGQANGGFVQNNANAAAVVPTTWLIAGTGDFNGDGRDDVLWRNVDGQMSSWLATASGGFVNNGAVSGVFVPLDWSVVAVGDYNGDGRDDILWRNTNGTLTDWLANANGSFTPNDAAAAQSVPTSWHVQPETSWL